MEDQEQPEPLPGQAEPEPTSEPEKRTESLSDKNNLPPIQSATPKPIEPPKEEPPSFSADYDTKENKLDDNDLDAEDLKTFSDVGDEGQGELEYFYVLLVECWEDVDTEGTDCVSVADLGNILNSLLNDEVIDFYQPEDLEMLAADMDADGSGYIPKLEFLDVMFRRQHGHAVQMDSSELGHKFVKLAKPGDKVGLDFTDKELEEAFKVFSLNQDRFGAKNIRAVMMAVDEMDVSAFDARKMIEAAATTPESIEQQSITFEEFKKMIKWTPEDEENQ